MNQIGLIRSKRVYSFGWWSTTACCVIAIVAICIFGSFFAVYSTAGFYMNSQKTYSQPKITFLNRFHTSITTQAGEEYVFGNLAQTHQQQKVLVKNVRSMTDDVDADDLPDSFTFSIDILKTQSQVQLRNIGILLLFSYQQAGYKDTFQTLFTIDGRDIAYANIFGFFDPLQNTYVNETDNKISSTNYLEQANRNISKASLKEAIQPIYVVPTISKQVINDNCDVASVSIRLSLSKYSRIDKYPSIFAQLIWSWCQFFPLFLAFGALGLITVLFCLQHEVLESRKRYQL